MSAAVGLLGTAWTISSCASTTRLDVMAMSRRSRSKPEGKFHRRLPGLQKRCVGVVEVSGDNLAAGHPVQRRGAKGRVLDLPGDGEQSLLSY